jgi:hypothetical protein
LPRYIGPLSDGVPVWNPVDPKDGRFAASAPFRRRKRRSDTKAPSAALTRRKLDEEVD